jgi:hypothetical protein
VFECIRSHLHPRDADASTKLQTFFSGDPVVVVSLAAPVNKLLTISRIQIEIEAPHMRCTSTAGFGLRANRFPVCIVALQGPDVFSPANRLANFPILEVVCISVASREKELMAVTALLAEVVTTYPSGAGPRFQFQFAGFDHL